MTEVSLVKYQGFVKEVTSDASNDVEVLIERLRELNKEANISLLLTGAAGLASEGGEFGELVKKCAFQGKPLDEATQHHMKRELGDIIWYWVNACSALNLDPNEVINENVHKLESRYPGGKFNVHSSENRDANDL
jgi:NTP pyrophosphatase (non-canonical NTP hydrolase)|tara:strand:- start:1494 stop:1898 length:405 start_codon:yes stop_codon:yes gene_type:complete